MLQMYCVAVVLFWLVVRVLLSGCYGVVGGCYAADVLCVCGVILAGC